MFRQTNAYLVEESKMDRAAELLREEVLAREVQDTLDLVADGIIDLPASWAPAPVKLHGAEGDLTSNENKENKSDTVIYPGESITEIPTMKMRTAGIVDVLLSKTALIIESFLMNMETTNDQKEAAIYRSEALSISDFYRLSTAHPYRKIEDVEKGDKDFLKDFFKAFRGHIWKNNFAWVGIERDGNRPEMRVLESKAPLFFGVATSNNRVVGVDLCSNALQGPFPSSILNAKDMQVIRLSYNNIIGRLPRGVASLVHLEVLALAANRIQGPLEPQMFKPLKMLRVLDLSFNSITGSVPDVFDDMIHLRELNLAGNQLSGELPSSMANLTQLEYLKLYNNRLQGNLPRWIENMTKLLEINLSQNNSLQKLILCYNEIKCEIDGAIGDLVELRVLYISHNKLSGRIPDRICDLLKLTHLNLSHNHIGGTLPRKFGENQGLKVCILGHNYITGPAPATLHKLSNTLQDFQLFTCYPSDCMMIPRAFERHTFERIFAWGPSARLNNVVWDERFDKTAVGSRYEPRETMDEYADYSHKGHSGLGEAPAPRRGKSPLPR